MGIKLAAQFPAYTALWRPWNDTAQNYDMPSVVQTGSGGGDRYADFSSGGLSYTYATAQTGDQDVRARVLPTSWAPGGGAARTILSRYDTNGTTRGWYFYSWHREPAVCVVG